MNDEKFTFSAKQEFFLVFLMLLLTVFAKFLVVEDLGCFFSYQKKVKGPHFGHVCYIPNASPGPSQG